MERGDRLALRRHLDDLEWNIGVALLLSGNHVGRLRPAASMFEHRRIVAEREAERQTALDPDDLACAKADQPFGTREALISGPSQTISAVPVM